MAGTTKPPHSTLRGAGASTSGSTAQRVDRMVPHPVYGALGWISVVNPGGRTADTVVGLLRAAHEAARARSVRRGGPDRS
ncbi:DUF6194 family protein [Streptomyces sp. NPDC058872]|uniref:DUF6194 family protein n=1 Tax=Streptomyces sp. NPDC058872 TaxID=3346661 RepID=UPI003676A072